MEKNINIFIIVYNTAQFLPKQLELMERFCVDENYTVYVVNNSPVENAEINNQIECEANKRGAVYLKTIPDAQHSNPSCSHASALNFVYREIGKNADYCLFLDHDIFPVSPFSVVEKLGNRLMAGVEQLRLTAEKKIQYLWAGLLFVNNTTMTEEDKDAVDFMPTSKYGIGLDTGGGIHELISRHGEKRFLFLNEKRQPNDAVVTLQNRYSYFSMVDDCWMHFINGSNWAKQKDEEGRLASLFAILEHRLEYPYPVKAPTWWCREFYLFGKKILIRIT